MFNSQTDFHKKFLGRLGEKKACKFLRKKGYKIIEKNYTSRFGEIDLIGLYGDFLVFIEVKFRANHDYGEAMEAVNYKKQERYRKTATFYLLCNKQLELQPRFDIVEVYPDHINHIEDAFQ